MLRISWLRSVRLLGIAFLATFAILFCAIGGFIFWCADPYHFRAPSDQKVIAMFQSHRSQFEAIGTARATSTPADTRSAALPPSVLSIGRDYDGRVRFVLAEGGLLVVGPGWAKGIEYVPDRANSIGEIQPDLDKARKLPLGVYLRAIEPHWFIFYQRDD
jgi:hypothetical protein